MKKINTSLEIFWKSLNEVILIIGSVFIGLFFVNPNIWQNHWVVYGIALIVISIISKIELKSLMK